MMKMENLDTKLNQPGPSNKLSVIIICISLLLSITSISCCVYLTMRLRGYENLIQTISQHDNTVEMVPGAAFSRQKRSGDSDSLSDEMELQLSDLSLGSLLNGVGGEGGGMPGRNGKDGKDGTDGVGGAVGPPGRDGRDGRDGVCNCTSSTSAPVADLTEVNNTLSRQESILTQLTTRLNDLVNLGTSVNVSGGSTYVRWGRTSCGNNSQRIYEGFAAGQSTHHEGGASNYECLPLRPEWNRHTITANDNYIGNWIYGVEYETAQYDIFPRNIDQQNVPCAHCFAPSRTATMMIPAQRTCPSGWNKEYEGYLMAGGPGEKTAYNYVCVDENPEYIEGLAGDATVEATMYFVQVFCLSMGHCPPYVNFAELTCVVCTK